MGSRLFGSWQDALCGRVYQFAGVEAVPSESVEAEGCERWSVSMTVVSKVDGADCYVSQVVEVVPALAKAPALVVTQSSWSDDLMISAPRFSGDGELRVRVLAPAEELPARLDWSAWSNSGSAVEDAEAAAAAIQLGVRLVAELNKARR